MQTNNPLSEQNHQLPHPSKKKSIIGLIYYPVHAIIVSAIIVLIFMAVGDFPDGEIPIHAIAQIALVTHLIQALFYSGVAWRFLKEDFARFKTNLGKNMKIAIVAPAVAQMFAIPYTLLMGHIGLVQIPSVADQLFRELLFANVPLMLIMAWVLAPIWEEILFRGMIFAPLRKRSRLLAYVISALAFGLIHTSTFMFQDGITMELLVTASFYFFTAVAFAWVYEKTNSLCGAIVAHMVSNVIGVAWLVFGV